MLGLKENVIFLGEKRREIVAKILPYCDLGVIPFDDDPLWLSAYTTKIFEYCASCLPVVVSIIVGADLEKLVKENDIGFVTEPMRPKELAEVILKAYDNRERLIEMRVNARRLAVERFDREKIARKMVEILLSPSYCGTNGRTKNA
jgi:glycosyltransferase involved in cell wall biosynthesis